MGLTTLDFCQVNRIARQQDIFQQQVCGRGTAFRFTSFGPLNWFATTKRSLKIMGRHTCLQGVGS